MKNKQLIYSSVKNIFDIEDDESRKKNLQIIFDEIYYNSSERFFAELLDENQLYIVDKNYFNTIGKTISHVILVLVTSAIVDIIAEFASDNEDKTSVISFLEQDDFNCMLIYNKLTTNQINTILVEVVADFLTKLISKPGETKKYVEQILSIKYHL